MNNHTCEFRRPDFTCEECGLFVMEYVEGIEDRLEDIEKMERRLRTALSAAEAKLEVAREALNYYSPMTVYRKDGAISFDIGQVAREALAKLGEKP